MDIKLEQHYDHVAVAIDGRRFYLRAEDRNFQKIVMVTSNGVRMEMFAQGFEIVGDKLVVRRIDGSIETMDFPGNLKCSLRQQVVASDKGSGSVWNPWVGEIAQDRNNTKSEHTEKA